MSGLKIRNFADAEVDGDVFYNGGVPYDSAGSLLVTSNIPALYGATAVGSGKEIFNISRTDTNADSVARPTMVYMEDTASPAADIAQDFHALDVKLQNSAANANLSANTGLYAVEGKTVTSASAGQTIGRSVGVYGVAVNAMSSGTLTNAIGVQGQVQVNTGGTVTNGFGMYIQSPSIATGTVTNLYGLYIQNQTSGSSTNYAIATFGGKISFFAGTATPAGGTAGVGISLGSTNNFGVFFGSGAPTLSAAQGSLYLRSDGSGTTDRAYINTNGSTTWTALTTAA